MRTPSRRAAAGFTLIETLVTLAIAGVLASVAYPGYKGLIQKARRSDARIALLTLQMTEERYRADRMAYGSLADIGMGSVTVGGHYTIGVPSATASGFEATASATGVQHADAPCRHLKLTVVGLNAAYASGPDTTVANSDAVNRRCWSL